MNAKTIIYCGAFVIAASILAPSIYAIWAYYSAFRAMRAADNDALGRAGEAMFETAFFGSLLMVAGVLVGTLLLIFGIYQNNRRAEK